MGWAIALIILYILAILLLIPVCVKANFDDGKWSVDVKYTFFRLFHKESEEKKPPLVPPKPLDQPDGDHPPAPLMPEPEESPTDESVPVSDTKSDEKPTVSEEKSEKESLLQKKHKKEPKKEENASDVPSACSETQKSDKKAKKRGFIERLKPHSLSEALGLAEDICAAASPAFSSLTRHIHLRHVKIYAAIGSDDAAKTALLYGRICTAAFNLLSQLQCRFDIDTEEFRILADFYNDSITFRGSLELRVSPAAALLIALILGSKFLWRTILRFRREDKEAKRRAKESAPVSEQAAV